MIDLRGNALVRAETSAYRLLPALKTPQLGLDLGALQVVYLGAQGWIANEHGCLLAATLAHAQDSLGLLVLIEGYQRGDRIDRARAALQRVARLPIDLHAGEHIVSPHHSGIVVRGWLCREWASSHQ